MNAPTRNERQARLLALLAAAADPVTGSELANRLGVTRQVVVHDIALLRAQHVPIVSTPRGYWLQREPAPRNQTLLAVHHPPALTETELCILVDHGLTVIDVLIEHPIYGELRGSLQLANRRDVRMFMEQVRRSGASLLSSLTDGHHMHTVAYDEESQLQDAVRELRRHGIQVFD